MLNCTKAAREWAVGETGFDQTGERRWEQKHRESMKIKKEKVQTSLLGSEHQQSTSPSIHPSSQFVGQSLRPPCATPSVQLNETPPVSLIRCEQEIILRLSHPFVWQEVQARIHPKSIAHATKAQHGSLAVRLPGSALVFRKAKSHLAVVSNNSLPLIRFPQRKRRLSATLSPQRELGTVTGPVAALCRPAREKKDVGHASHEAGKQAAK